MTDRTSPRRRQVPAVTRAVAILRQLGRTAEPIGVNQIARELGLVPSTCLHILRVLADEGLVTFNPQTKGYAIGVGILSIARSAIQRNTFAGLIEPRLTELSVKFGGTAVATQLVDADIMIVVALSRARQPFRLQVDLGSRFPALISATGRCHAAFNLSDVSESRLKSRFEKLKWDFPPDFRTWLGDIERARSDGYAVDRGSYIGGVTVLAVPFLDANARMIHSIVAIDITERIDAIGVSSIVEEMLRIRDDVNELAMVGSV
jgi:DNA-binding IclR family transcriptional regulator